MRYRWAISYSLLAHYLVIVCTVAWVLGYGPVFIPQVAWAADVNANKTAITDINAKLNTLVLLSVKSGINQQLKSLCQAGRAKNQDDMDSANNQIGPLLDSYRTMTGHEYHLQSCDTVLVQSN